MGNDHTFHLDRFKHFKRTKEPSKPKNITQPLQPPYMYTTTKMPIPTLASLSLPFPNLHTSQDRLTVALSATALLASTLILPAAYRDYKIFKSYGPGGPPHNALGWLIVRALFQPFGREMFSTDEYVRRIAAAEGHGTGDEGFLTLSEEQLGSRSAAERPVVGPHVAPQRQLTQVPDEAVMEVCGCDFVGLFLGSEM
jgi:hypothetical protein